MAEEIGALRAVLALESAAFDRGVQSARRQLNTLEGGLQRTGGQVTQFGRRMSRDTSTAFNDVARSSNGARAGLQNFGFQVQDVAVQIAGGTSATRALSQQLPQLLSGFGLFGVVLGTASAILIPFASYLLGASEKSLTLKESLDALGKSMSALDSASRAAQQPIQDLIGVYGEYAAQAERINIVNRQLAYLDAASALSATAAAITGAFGRLERDTTEDANLPAYLDELVARFGSLNPDSVLAVSEALSITEDAAILLTEQMVRLSEAQGPEQQVEALQNVISQLELATGGAFEMDEGARAVYGSLLDALSAAQQLASIDLQAGITAAADEAARLAANIQASLNYGKIQNTSGSGADMAAREAINRRPNPFGVLAGGAGGVAVPPRRGGGGGGGGSAQKEANELQREAARVFEQTRTAAEKYAAEVEKLDQLQAKGLISADTYNRAIGDLGEKTKDVASATSSLTSSFEDAFTSFVTGASSAQEAASNLLGQLASLFASSAFKSLLGEGGGGFFDAIGGFLSNANGNAFANGRVQAFARGGVVNGPTLFPMANGTGLMGEAGPEAVMPLTRIGGKLGVVAKGGGGQVINIDARGAVEGTDALIVRRLKEALPSFTQAAVGATRSAAVRGAA